MKRLSLIPLIFLLVSFVNVNAQDVLNTLLNSANSNLGAGLPDEKIVKGLKEALTKGTTKSAVKAAATDGFYKNPLIKVPFPPEAKQMEKTLRQVGMSKQVDSFIKSLNRAAEDAAKKSAPIFIHAITSMNINDGLKILRGNNTAATEFLQNKTTPELKAEFRPVIKNSLKKVDVAKYWKSIAKSYNQMPMVKKMNPDLEEYVTEKTIEGLFKLIAEEEAKIRKDPVATGSSLIQEVFGGR